MLRRAPWRRLPQDPRSPLAWWVRETHAALGALLLIPGLIVGSFLFGRMLHSPTLAFGGWAFAALIGARTLARKENRSRALAQLAPSPAPVEAFPIAFELTYQGVVTGRDEGIASFVDGWLQVEGLRSGFSLRPLDATRVGAMPDGSEAFDLPGGQRITLRALGSPSDRATFGETVRVWYRFAVGASVGEPTLPPLRVHPSAVVPPLTILALTGFVVPAILAWALWTVIVHPDYAGTLMPAFFGFAVGSRPVGKAIQDLRKLKSIDHLALESEERETLAPRPKS